MQQSTVQPTGTATMAATIPTFTVRKQLEKSPMRVFNLNDGDVSRTLERMSQTERK